ncbi:NAD-dependent epimerase/dehydratase family protein [Candidatus Wolfebacteria bacterium]|nr:NAD-dependent epimerase/dehydratase family protein [Candidatus Magasanikbacteria bacterium]MBI5401612.1 NAD-dependent epimerase/dehydratase family protein [Candidatus Wolfebacteria bacterium]
MNEKYIILGGAGFIGGHFVDHLLDNNLAARVTIYDNFSSGREWHYERHLKNKSLNVVRGDLKDLEKLKTAMAGHDIVIHLASNPDIAKAATEPDIDFWEGTYLTQNAVEAMRVTSAKKILYASGSGVYGDLGEVEAHEDYGPLIPISTYGASKLAGEGLISSYCHMFGLTGKTFRFGNVVGSRQTHGVGFDFARRLLKNPSELTILGDGMQSKSYIHVSDIIHAVLLASAKENKNFNAYNVATGDYITVAEIAELAVDILGLRDKPPKFIYTGGNRGWKGDVPIIRLNTDRIKNLGWTCKKNTKEALTVSINSMIEDMKNGLI